MFDGEPKRPLEREQEGPPAPRQTRPERERPLSEVRGLAWKAFLGCWLTYLAAALIFFGGSRTGLFTVGVVAGVALAFFGIPWALLRVTRKMKGMPDQQVVEISGGRISQSEALIQIVLAPAALAAAMAIIGYIATHQERAGVWIVAAPPTKHLADAIPPAPTPPDQSRLGESSRAPAPRSNS